MANSKLITSLVRYKDIPEFLGYRVGDNGSVWSRRDFHGGLKDEWRQLRAILDKDGYESVVLYSHGKRHTKKVHHLVLEAFVGPRLDGMEARHFPDPSPSNNHANNLMWGTHQSNIDDKTTVGTVARGEGHGMATLTPEDAFRVHDLRSSGFSFTKIGAVLGISRRHAWAIHRGKYWKHLKRAQQTKLGD